MKKMMGLVMIICLNRSQCNNSLERKNTKQENTKNINQKGNDFDKGQQIIVEGRLAVKSYVGKDDVKRKDVYIVADGINFCGAKSSDAHEKEVEEAFESYDEPESLF